MQPFSGHAHPTSNQATDHIRAKCLCTYIHTTDLIRLLPVSSDLCTYLYSSCPSAPIAWAESRHGGPVPGNSAGKCCHLRKPWCGVTGAEGERRLELCDARDRAPVTAAPSGCAAGAAGSAGCSCESGWSDEPERREVVYIPRPPRRLDRWWLTACAYRRGWYSFARILVMVKQRCLLCRVRLISIPIREFPFF